MKKSGTLAMLDDESQWPPPTTSTLDLSKTKMSILPPNLTWRLPALTSLSLSHNQFTHVPLSLFLLPNLKNLCLSYNSIQILPQEIVCLPSLTKLDLSNNLLIQIPSSVSLLTCLNTLNLQSNHLRSLPVELGALSNHALKTLVVLDNPFLISPPSYICKKGTKVMLAYLRYIDPALNLSLSARYYNHHPIRLGTLSSSQIKLKKKSTLPYPYQDMPPTSVHFRVEQSTSATQGRRPYMEDFWCTFPEILYSPIYGVIHLSPDRLLENPYIQVSSPTSLDANVLYEQHCKRIETLTKSSYYRTKSPSLTMDSLTSSGEDCVRGSLSTPLLAKTLSYESGQGQEEEEDISDNSVDDVVAEGSDDKVDQASRTTEGTSELGGGGVAIVIGEGPSKKVITKDSSVSRLSSVLLSHSPLTHTSSPSSPISTNSSTSSSSSSSSSPSSPLSPASPASQNSSPSTVAFQSRTPSEKNLTRLTNRDRNIVINRHNKVISPSTTSHNNNGSNNGNNAANKAVNIPYNLTSPLLGKPKPRNNRSSTEPPQQMLRRSPRDNIIEDTDRDDSDENQVIDLSEEARTTSNIPPDGWEEEIQRICLSLLTSSAVNNKTNTGDPNDPPNEDKISSNNNNTNEGPSFNREEIRTKRERGDARVRKTIKFLTSELPLPIPMLPPTSHHSSSTSPLSSSPKSTSPNASIILPCSMTTSSPLSPQNPLSSSSAPSLHPGILPAQSSSSAPSAPLSTSSTPTVMSTATSSLLYRVGYYGLFDGHGGAAAAEYCIHNLFNNIFRHSLSASLEQNNNNNNNNGSNSKDKPLRNSMSETATNQYDFLEMDSIINGYEKTDQQFLKSNASEKEKAPPSPSTKHAKAHPRESAGTTATTVFFIGNRMVIAFVGDSRAVLCRDNKIPIRLTPDHKPNRPDEKLRIEAQNAVVKKLFGVYRINGSLAVSRSIGDGQLKPNIVIPTPEIRSEIITPRDSFVVIASDGLWDVLTDLEVVKFVQKYNKTTFSTGSYAVNSLNSGGGKDSNSPNQNNSIYYNNNEIARELVRKAYMKGSADNITCIVLFFRWDVSPVSYVPYYRPQDSYHPTHIRSSAPDTTSLLTPSSSSSPSPHPQPAAFPTSSSLSGRTSPGASSSGINRSGKSWKVGLLDDENEEDEELFRGTSLPGSLHTSNQQNETAQQPVVLADDFDWTYTPSPTGE